MTKPDDSELDDLEGEYQSARSKLGTVATAIIALLVAGVVVAFVSKSFTGNREDVAKRMRLKQAVSRFNSDPTSPAFAKEAVEAYEASGKPADAEQVRKRHDEALHTRDAKREQDLRDRLKQDPKDGVTLGLLLDLLVQRGDSGPARTAYQAFLDADPTPKKRAAFGTWLYRNKFSQDAVDELTRSLKGYDQPETHAYLGFALLDLGKRREGYAEITRAFHANADIPALREKYFELAKEFGETPTAPAPP